MKGWFGKLECEEPAIMKEPAQADAASVRHILLGPDRKGGSNESKFQETPTNTKKIQHCQAHFMPTYSSETKVPFVES